MKIEKVDVNLKLLQESFSGLENVNQYVQTGLSPVTRWSQIRKSRLYTLFHPQRRLRRQDDLQHSFSMAVLTANVCLRLRPYLPKLDAFLVVVAAMVHELGEAVLRSDVCFLLKDKSRDADEYSAFVRRFSVLDAELLDYYRRAFLLQFVGIEAGEREEAWAPFSESDRKIMQGLRETSFVEALVFRYCERLEYILYALEQGHNFRNYTITEEILRNHICDMSQACEKIPGWKQKIWTPEIDNLAKSTQLELTRALPKKFMPEVKRGK